MQTPTTKKFTPEIYAQLYDEFVAVAERNGQTKRHVLEEALRFYLHKRGSVAAPGALRGDGYLRAIGGSQPRSLAAPRKNKSQMSDYLTAAT
jgi:hypothetical protein